MSESRLNGTYMARTRLKFESFIIAAFVTFFSFSAFDMPSMEYIDNVLVLSRVPEITTKPQLSL